MKKNNKIFVSIIWGYFKHFYELAPEENYHLNALKIAKKLGFSLVVMIKDDKKFIESDPNFDQDIKIIYFKNNLIFFIHILKLAFKGSIFYVNSYEWQSFMIPFMSRKTIFMAHTQPSRKNKIKQAIQNFVYRFFKYIRLNNQAEKDFLITQGIDPRKLFIIPLIVSNNVFKLLNNGIERKNLVYFGNITEKKNLLTILRAFERVKGVKSSIKLNIIGNLWDNSIKDFVDKSKSKRDIIFHGFLPNDQLVVKLNENLIYLNSSVDEGQCVAVYDAALCGCTLCLPNIMSFVEVFKDKALFHDVYDYKQLATNIVKYLENHDLAMTYNKKCSKMIKDEYNKNIIEKKFMDLILRF